MNKKFIVGIVILIIIAVAGFFIYQNKKPVENNPGGSEVINSNNQNNTNNQTGFLTKHYDIITGEENIKAKFIEYQDKLEEAVKAFKDGGESPSSDYFIEKAKYAQYLGHNDWAIEILNDIFSYYENSSIAWNNLAKLYEADKNYIKANEYYQKIIDTFGEKNNSGYYYYICMNLMYMNNKEGTQKCYDTYKKFGGQDSQIEDYLNK